ncbi:cytochrome P450 98A3 [Coprinopsis marcescibilis]|uniref:Cytochrome P450 98A3 n=1 Tax=Coprinopsis marcescibilis TaxID=230819 RepID=A0A5C3KJ31_COPMA|nr:cytochrome P450 98A3 [Coprinopsis marcescibilis]
MDKGEALGRWQCVIALAVVVGGLAVKSALSKEKSNPKGLPLPPGPKGLPVLGNALQIPQTKAWLVYDEWAKKYGDVMFVEALGQKIIILNSLSAATDLLEKRALNYSDRLALPSFEMMGFNWNFSLVSYGKTWRAHRRAFHQCLNHNQTVTYLPIVEEEMRGFMRHLSAKPEDLYHHARNYFGSVIMRVAYGVNDFKYNSPLIDDAETLIQRFSETTVPGRLLVNSFSFLRHVPDWFPGTQWKQTLKEVAVISDRVVSKPFSDAKIRLNTDPEQDKYPSMVKELMPEIASEANIDHHEQEIIARNTAAQTYIAGSDTTMTSMLALIAVLLVYPDVQKKARDEVDAVIGCDRLPNAQDLDHLPYIEALVKEVSRWFTVLPMGVPHQSRDDDEYNGYFIPGKTLFLMNAWAMMHDPEVFTNPFDFNPDRYLKDGKIDPSVLDPEAAAFGFGRRICPGRYFSNATLKLSIASLLAVFDIRPAKDEAGNDIPVTIEQTSDLVSRVEPFQYDISPRSTHHFALLA